MSDTAPRFRERRARRGPGSSPAAPTDETRLASVNIVNRRYTIKEWPPRSSPLATPTRASDPTPSGVSTSSDIRSQCRSCGQISTMTSTPFAASHPTHPRRPSSAGATRKCGRCAGVRSSLGRSHVRSNARMALRARRSNRLSSCHEHPHVFVSIRTPPRVVRPLAAVRRRASPIHWGTGPRPRRGGRSPGHPPSAARGHRFPPGRRPGRGIDNLLLTEFGPRFPTPGRTRERRSARGGPGRYSVSSRTVSPVRAERRAASRISVTIMLFDRDESPSGSISPRTTPRRYGTADS